MLYRLLEYKCTALDTRLGVSLPIAEERISGEKIFEPTEIP
jgi:hypothetical protein